MDASCRDETTPDLTSSSVSANTTTTTTTTTTSFLSDGTPAPRSPSSVLPSPNEDEEEEEEAGMMAGLEDMKGGDDDNACGGGDGGSDLLRTPSEASDGPHCPFVDADAAVPTLMNTTLSPIKKRRSDGGGADGIGGGVVDVEDVLLSSDDEGGEEGDGDGDPASSKPPLQQQPFRFQFQSITLDDSVLEDAAVQQAGSGRRRKYPAGSDTVHFDWKPLYLTASAFLVSNLLGFLISISSGVAGARSTDGERQQQAVLDALVLVFAVGLPFAVAVAGPLFRSPSQSPQVPARVKRSAALIGIWMSTKLFWCLSSMNAAAAIEESRRSNDGAAWRFVADGRPLSMLNRGSGAIDASTTTQFREMPSLSELLWYWTWCWVWGMACVLPHAMGSTSSYAFTHRNGNTSLPSFPYCVPTVAFLIGLGLHCIADYRQYRLQQAAVEDVRDRLFLLWSPYANDDIDAHGHQKDAKYYSLYGDVFLYLGIFMFHARALIGGARIEEGEELVISSCAKAPRAHAILHSMSLSDEATKRSTGLIANRLFAKYWRIGLVLLLGPFLLCFSNYGYQHAALIGDRGRCDWLSASYGFSSTVGAEVSTAGLPTALPWRRFCFQSCEDTLQRQKEEWKKQLRRGNVATGPPQKRRRRPEKQNISHAEQGHKISDRPRQRPQVKREDDRSKRIGEKQHADSPESDRGQTEATIHRKAERQKYQEDDEWLDDVRREIELQHRQEQEQALVFESALQDEKDQQRSREEPERRNSEQDEEEPEEERPLDNLLRWLPVLEESEGADSAFRLDENIDNSGEQDTELSRDVQSEQPEKANASAEQSKNESEFSNVTSATFGRGGATTDTGSFHFLKNRFFSARVWGSGTPPDGRANNTTSSFDKLLQQMWKLRVREGAPVPEGADVSDASKSLSTAADTTPHLLRSLRLDRLRDLWLVDLDKACGKEEEDMNDHELGLTPLLRFLKRGMNLTNRRSLDGGLKELWWVNDEML